MSDNLPAPSVATLVRAANSDCHGKCLICDAEPDWQCDEVVHKRASRPTHGQASLPALGPHWQQPKPTPSNGPDVLDLVIRDLKDRAALGIVKYGQPLRPHNGRDALWDAYCEALDLCKYLRQKIEEERKT